MTSANAGKRAVAEAMSLRSGGSRPVSQSIRLSFYSFSVVAAVGGMETVEIRNCLVGQSIFDVPFFLFAVNPRLEPCWRIVENGKPCHLLPARGSGSGTRAVTVKNSGACRCGKPSEKQADFSAGTVENRGKNKRFPVLHTLSKGMCRTFQQSNLFCLTNDSFRFHRISTQFSQACGKLLHFHIVFHRLLKRGWTIVEKQWEKPGERL